MRKFFIILLILCFVLPSLSAKAKEAQYSSVAEEQAATQSATTGSMNLKIFPGGTLQAILDKAQGYLFAFALVAAVIMITWGGIDFITSGGDPKKITVARNKIKNALIGIVVIIFAEGIILVVQNLLQTK